jgi:hypothetical protein
MRQRVIHVDQKTHDAGHTTCAKAQQRQNPSSKTLKKATLASQHLVTFMQHLAQHPIAHTEHF